MNEICHICHESVNDWELEWIEVPEIGKLKICGECLEKVQDFIGMLLNKEGEKVDLLIDGKKEKNEFEYAKVHLLERVQRLETIVEELRRKKRNGKQGL